MLYFIQGSMFCVKTDNIFCLRFNVLFGNKGSILFKVQCSMWQAMKILGQEFGFYIPVMPVGGK